MVKEDERLQNLTQEEVDAHIAALNEHRNNKVNGVRANNIAASRDVLAITDKISKEVSDILTVLQLLIIIPTSSKAFAIAPVSTPHCWLYEDISMMPFNRHGPQLIIQQNFGRTFSDSRSLILPVNMNSGLVPRTRVSLVPSRQYVMFTPNNRSCRA